MRVRITGKRGTRSGCVLVEDEEALEHLKLVLVRHGAPDLVVQLRVRERHLRAQALVRERRPDRRLSA